MSTQPYTVLKYSKYLRTELPAHWVEKRLGYLSMQVRNAFVDGPFGSDLKTTDYQDEGVPLIQLNNIRDSKHVLQNMKFISEEKRNQLKRHIAKPKDVVFAKMADPVARSAVVANDFPEYVIVADCVKMTPDVALINLNFLVWAINSDCVRINAELVSTGTTRVRVSLGDLQKLKIPYPPIDEQQAIARFLDHKTAKIDALIEKQQRLIELLKEKRQAVISHAVTKGLNPNASMKDSGVEWLGEVPAHWVVSRVKDVTTKIVDGPHFSPPYVDDGYMFLSARNIKVDRWALSDAKYISEENFREFNKRIKPEKGDVLLTKGGTTGVARAVDLDFDFQVWVHIAVLKTVKSKIDHFFLAHSLNGKSCYEQSQLSTYGATNNDLGLSRIANIVFAAPPLEEQHAICDFINDKCSKLDNLISNSLVSIELMQERRTALISAAVTGKIDVRDWQAAV